MGLANLSPPQSPPLGGKSELLPPAGGGWEGGELLLPIVSARWRRVTFIVTTGDRFMNALEINDLFEQESAGGQLYVRLKELGIPAEREWWIDEEGTAYIVDLALPVGDGWLPVTFGERPGPTGGLRFAAKDEPDACLRDVPPSEAKRD